MTAPKKKGPRQYSPEFIAQKIAEFEQSGLAQVRFAHKHGLNPSTFYGWLGRAGKLTQPREPAPPTLLPVSLKAPRPEHEAALLLELPSGARLILPPTTDLQALAALLRAL